MRREVEFLGHKLGQEGISTLEEKIHTITEWPTPADQKQLKSFLGLASYYRRFVKGFSSIAAPLFRLLQKDRDFIWTQDYTDTSNVGLGAVLSQVGPDGEKVVAYFSQVLNRNRGNRYVLVAMDYFTKWPEAYAIPDQEAETVADVLVEGMFSRFGTSETLHSDQGRNFESKVFAAICERLGIKKTHTTPLHPQSDGLVERFNRTLAQQLAILTSEHQQNWDYHLPLILMPYRSAVQDSTQCTPALLMLGRELRTPAELAFGKSPDTLEAPPGRDYARKLQDRLDSAHSYAREQLAKAGLRQKRNYDITTKGRHFHAGELVWVYSPKRKKGWCPKLDSSWVGPCSILERVGEVVYRVQLPPRGRKVALHRDRMAPYRGQSLPSFPEGRVQSPRDPAQRDPRPELRSPPSGSSPQSPKAPCTSQGLRRSRRERRLPPPPPRLRDCVVPSGTRNLLLGGGQCNDG
ncbi:unnamed protein product [Oreochromis niloticus]|nr:unnamed protein product [Mustela putorius furo]